MDASYISLSSRTHPCKAAFASQSARTGCWGSLLNDKIPCVTRLRVHQGPLQCPHLPEAKANQERDGPRYCMLLHFIVFRCRQRNEGTLADPSFSYRPPCKVVFLASPGRWAGVSGRVGAWGATMSEAIHQAEQGCRRADGDVLSHPHLCQHPCNPLNELAQF